MVENAFERRQRWTVSLSPCAGHMVRTGGRTVGRTDKQTDGRTNGRAFRTGEPTDYGKTYGLTGKLAIQETQLVITQR